MGHKPAHGIDEPLNGLLGHLKKGVLHDEFSSSEELLELAHLVRILGNLIQRIPWFSKLLLDGRVFIEVGLDDVLSLGHPGLLEIVRDLRGRTLLDL
jgi:hypothetical protein